MSRNGVEAGARGDTAARRFSFCCKCVAPSFVSCSLEAHTKKGHTPKKRLPPSIPCVQVILNLLKQVGAYAWRQPCQSRAIASSRTWPGSPGSGVGSNVPRTSRIWKGATTLV